MFSGQLQVRIFVSGGRHPRNHQHEHTLLALCGNPLRVLGGHLLRSKNFVKVEIGAP